MGFISLFSPAVRVLPRSSVRLGGDAVWISPIIAMAAVLGIAAAMQWFMKNRGEGEGMGELILRSVGPAAGRAVLVLTAIWLVLYAGFILRISAERLLAAVFERGGIWIFVVMTLGVSVMAALGKTRSLARTAQIMLIFGILMAVIILFSLVDIRAENLLPVEPAEIKGIFLGAIPIINVQAIFVYFMFLLGHCRKKPGGVKQAAGWIAAATAGILIIILTTIGTMSAGLTERLRNPFFTMIKNITVFGTVERIEAVVVAAWVITDFMLLAVLLTVGSEIIKLTVPRVKRTAAVLAEAAVVLAAALLISSSMYEQQILSESIVPVLNLCFTLAVFPAVLIIGKIRRKI